MSANPNSALSRPGHISTLLRGEVGRMSAWVREQSASRAVYYVLAIIIGAGLYGAAMGCWRAPEQALYGAVKLPLIVLLTTFCNGLLNGMLAPLLGLSLGFRQSLLAVLMSFTVSASILGAFSPVALFLVWNAPPMTPHSLAYFAFQLLHVAVIAFAGTVGNLRLADLLEQLGGSQVVGRRVLLSWLTVNLLLGSQLTWILRPIIGSPGLPLQFLRPHPFDGNFFESVYHALMQLLFS